MRRRSATRHLTERNGLPRGRLQEVGSLSAGAPLIGAKLSDSRAALPLPGCGERSEFARSSRKFRVRGPLHESELCAKAFSPLAIPPFVERPPHPDPLPASGEREQTCTNPVIVPR